MSTAQGPTAEELESLRKTVEDLRDELEREREARRAIERKLAAHFKQPQHDVEFEWDTGMIEDLSVRSTTGAEFPLGNAERPLNRIVIFLPGLLLGEYPS